MHSNRERAEAISLSGSVNDPVTKPPVSSPQVGDRNLDLSSGSLASMMFTNERGAQYLPPLGL